MSNTALWDGNPATEPLYTVDELTDMADNAGEDKYQSNKEDHETSKME